MNFNKRLFDDKQTSKVLQEKIQETKDKKDLEEKQKVQQQQPKR